MQIHYYLGFHLFKIILFKIHFSNEILNNLNTKNPEKSESMD